MHQQSPSNDFPFKPEVNLREIKTTHPAPKSTRKSMAKSESTMPRIKISRDVSKKSPQMRLNLVTPKINLIESMPRKL